jgi:hypothetical protein
MITGSALHEPRRGRSKFPGGSLTHEHYSPKSKRPKEEDSDPKLNIENAGWG